MQKQQSESWDEQDVLKKLKAGEELAFGKLYGYYSEPVYSRLLLLFEDRVTAGEIIKELFLMVWEKRTQIIPTHSFKSYLYAIAENLAYDHFGSVASDRKLQGKDLRKHISGVLHRGEEPGSLSRDEQQDLAVFYKSITAQLKVDEGIEVISIPFYKRKAFVYLTVACLALIATGIGTIFYKNYPDAKFPDLGLEFATQDIPPGGHRASLTLADGRTIVLNEAADGNLVDEEGILIRKTGHGQLVYEVSNNQVKAATYMYNTITTPKGGTYQIKLPDGSNVWLNAASTIRFPTSFTLLKERKIELSGEAYFEVAKDKKHPFMVIANKQEVEILGTHFNISSYTDDMTAKTTLVEGSIRVHDLQKPEGGSVVLEPGQQSTIDNAGITVAKVELSDVLAWKNGFFAFNDEPLESIMKKIARWYDVDVVYERVDKNKLLKGSVSRFDPVSKVLKQLELTGGLYFKVEVGKIVVKGQQ